MIVKADRAEQRAAANPERPLSQGAARAYRIRLCYVAGLVVLIVIVDVTQSVGGLRLIVGVCGLTFVVIATVIKFARMPVGRRRQILGLRPKETGTGPAGH